MNQSEPQNLSLAIGIIADDLTSAADAGGAFVNKGMRVSVCRKLQKRDDSISPGVVAIDCVSRSMSALEAAQTVEVATRELAGAPILLKTIDSTLRGHVREELQASFLASGRTRVVIAPAFPENGRTTVNGIQYVDAIPVDASSYARDPVHPVTTARIADLIPEGINSAIILDAESQKALNAQVAAIDNPEDVLWVGSPGLARALAELTTIDVANKAAANKAPTPFSAFSLIVVGSANAVSREQVMRAQDALFATCITAPNIRTDNPQAILSEIVKKATVALQDRKIGALIATGGDTMHAILEKLNINDFELIGEFEPGFPIGRTRMNEGRSLVLGMKAGGFGDPNTLYSAAERLSRGFA